MAETLHKPDFGKLTFESEGNNKPESKYFSRRASVPPGSSGVTIGRGYDMKHRSKQEVQEDLVSAGVPNEDSAKLSDGAGLTGVDAKAFVDREDIKKIIISEEAQKKLFEIVYPIYFNQAKVICQKAHLENESYGKCKWVNMDTKVKELIADLIYRGDYTRTTRTKIQEALVNGDKNKILEALDKLTNVPFDRQKRRKNYLK